MARGARGQPFAPFAAARACVVRYSTRTIARATGDAVTHTTVALFLRGGHVSPTSREVIERTIRRLEAEHLAAVEARQIADDLLLARGIRRAIGA
jgi:hypothetical protein